MRRKNPTGRDIGRVERPKKKKRQRKLSKADERKIQLETYKERAKRLRPFFGDTFGAAEGFDLRSPGSWTPAQKAKVTKYFRVMAPNITGDFVVKRYRKKESIQAAVDESLQEKALPGQTAVAFKKYSPKEKLEVKIDRKSRVTVKRSNVGIENELFNKAAFLADPKAEIKRVLDKYPKAKVFRLIVGANNQLKMLTREQVDDEIADLLERYPDASKDTRAATDFIRGLTIYSGSALKAKSSVQKFIERQKQSSAKREIERLDKLSKQRGGRGYSPTIAQHLARRRRTKK